MDPAAFLRSAKLMIVAGKGGVCKTTVAATVARVGADFGLRVLLVDVDGAAGLASAFGAGDLRYDDSALAIENEVAGGCVYGRRLAPDDALVEYLEGHGMRRLAGRLQSSGALDVIATAAPGIKDILVLGKIKQIVQSGAYDLVIVDTPASGHAVTFLRGARSVADTVSGGPIRRQADEVLELLTDHARCQVLLVTLAEETPVSEVIETAFALEDLVGVALGPVVVNAVLGAVPPFPTGRRVASLPADAVAAVQAALAFGRQRVAGQSAQRARLATELPLAQLTLPQLPGTGIGPELLRKLADDLAAALRAMPEPTATVTGVGQR